MGLLSSILDWLGSDILSILAALAAHDNRMELDEEETLAPDIGSLADTVGVPVPQMVRIER